MSGVECWLPVVGYEGCYEVSDLARVRSLRRWVDRKDGSGQFIAEKILAQFPHGPRCPYPKVSLCKNGVQKSWAVHRLVLDAFVGPCPDGMEACHDNGDHTNSTLANLRWDTHRENWRDSARHGTAHIQAPATECQKGHPLKGDNVRLAIKQGRLRRDCKQCEADRRLKKGHLRRDSHCRNGHQVSPENTFIKPNGYRQCRLCRQIGREKEYAKRRATREVAGSLA